MLQWLRDLYNGANGALSAIERWIVGAINAVYSYFSGLISQLWNVLQQVASAINGYINQIEQSLYSLYILAQWIVTKGIPQLANWALGELNKLYDYARSVYNWAIMEINRLGVWAVGELNKLTQWVIQHIWDPLWTAITSAIKWIENEGTYVYFLLTHPDKLAALLAQYIISQWMNLGKRFAKPFIKWLVHNMIAEVPTVSSVIEDIIASLF